MPRSFFSSPFSSSWAQAWPVCVCRGGGSGPGAGLGLGLSRRRGPKGGSERSWSRGPQGWETPQCSWKQGRWGWAPSSQAKGHGGWSREARQSSLPPHKGQQIRATLLPSPTPQPTSGLKVPQAHSPSTLRESSVSPQKCGPLIGPEQLAAGDGENVSQC